MSEEKNLVTHKDRWELRLLRRLWLLAKTRGGRASKRKDGRESAYLSPALAK
jgi:hypothetical protein